MDCCLVRHRQTTWTANHVLIITTSSRQTHTKRFHHHVLHVIKNGKGVVTVAVTVTPVQNACHHMFGYRTHRLNLALLAVFTWLGACIVEEVVIVSSIADNINWLNLFY